jgi:hypothetical protein
MTYKEWEEWEDLELQLRKRIDPWIAFQNQTAGIITGDVTLAIDVMVIKGDLTREQAMESIKSFANQYTRIAHMK